MTIPDYQSLMLPLLKYSADQKEHSLRETIEVLADQFALTDERLSGVDARLNYRVYGTDTDIYGRPGPRLVEALEELAALLHPELFP